MSAPREPAGPWLSLAGGVHTHDADAGEAEARPAPILPGTEVARAREAGAAQRAALDLDAIEERAARSAPYRAAGTVAHDVGLLVAEVRRLRDVAASVCIYCRDQPHDPSPCPCSHSPCVHDAVRLAAEYGKALDERDAWRARAEVAEAHVAHLISNGAVLRALVDGAEVTAAPE